jgi:two-component system, NtrC family, nitrogen regulation sensor histidine kinase NtrY
LSFRRKLLLVFALTVFVSVAAVAWIVSAFTRSAFEHADDERTSALVKQFQREFTRRGEDVVRQVDAIASSDAATRMALALSRSAPDYGAYLNEARTLADTHQLDFLEFVDNAGTIISSAQSPAKYGYKEPALNLAHNNPKEAYLKVEDLTDGPAIGLFATRAVTVGDTPVYVIGGRRLDKDFLASLELPAGMRAFLYQNLSGSFVPKYLIDPSGTLRDPAKLAPVIESVRRREEEDTDKDKPAQTVHWTSNPADDESFHAIPLEGPYNQLVGVLLVGSSRRAYVDLERRITSVALLVGGSGILIAILLSGWVAGRVTRPVEELAAAAREVGAGNWNVQVQSTADGDLGELVDAFNRMTRELIDQRERLVRTERVAAWRELARRLAHELKNPLFPLQLTVENLLRARQHSPEMFEEMFQESTATLLAEIANLKTIIGRFSEFSKMPQPKFQRVDVNEIVQGVMRLFQGQLEAKTPKIEAKLELSSDLTDIAADADLLHRALSNLVLNAIDAMPHGGTLTLRTLRHNGGVELQITDSGTGLTPEECERLFTPYYTSKQHGTGLGLAIVQSVVTDHGGRITVDSAPGRGTTFRIELPGNQDKIETEASSNDFRVRT